MTAAPDRSLLRACTAEAREIFPNLRGPDRRLTQTAAYLAVVELELPPSRVRRWLGWTRRGLDDACVEVEDLREEIAIDELIAGAGGRLRARHDVRTEPQGAAPVADLGAQRAARAARRALELLVHAGGGLVAHEAFGSMQTARTAIWAARREIGPDAIRTVRGRGFRMTQAGLRAALELGRFDGRGDSPDLTRLPVQAPQQAAA